MREEDGEREVKKKNEIEVVNVDSIIEEQNEMEGYEVDLPPDNDLENDLMEATEGDDAVGLKLLANATTISQEQQPETMETDLEQQGYIERNEGYDGPITFTAPANRKRKGREEKVDTQKTQKVTITDERPPKKALPTPDNVEKTDNSPKRQYQQSKKNTNDLYVPQNDTTNIRRYKEADDENMKEYIVYIEPAENRTNKNLNPTSIGKVIATSMKGKLNFVIKSGASKITVSLKTAREANMLLQNTDLLESNQLRATLPYHKLSRQGLIRNVPLDITCKEIYDEISDKWPLLSVKRLSKKNRRPDAQAHNKYIPSQTILLQFSGQTIPDYITLYASYHTVDVYVTRPKICFNCFRYNHIKEQCKSEARCDRCGEKRHLNAEGMETECTLKSTDSYKCINCQENHKPTSFDCPEHQFQVKIRTLAAHQNLSLSEATSFLTKHDPPSHITRYNINTLNNKGRNTSNASSNKENFPTLQKSQVNSSGTQSGTDENTEVYERYINNKQFYSSVTKNGQNGRVYYNSNTRIPQRNIRVSRERDAADKLKELYKKHQTCLVNNNGRINNNKTPIIEASQNKPHSEKGGAPSNNTESDKLRQQKQSIKTTNSTMKNPIQTMEGADNDAKSGQIEHMVKSITFLLQNLKNLVPNNDKGRLSKLFEEMNNFQRITSNE